MARRAQVAFGLSLHRAGPIAPHRRVGNIAIGLDLFAEQLRAAQQVLRLMKRRRSDEPLEIAIQGVDELLLVEQVAGA